MSGEKRNLLDRCFEIEDHLKQQLHLLERLKSLYRAGYRYLYEHDEPYQDDSNVVNIMQLSSKNEV